MSERKNEPESLACSLDQQPFFPPLSFHGEHPYLWRVFHFPLRWANFYSFHPAWDHHHLLDTMTEEADKQAPCHSASRELDSPTHMWQPLSLRGKCPSTGVKWEPVNSLKEYNKEVTGGQQKTHKLNSYLVWWWQDSSIYISGIIYVYIHIYTHIHTRILTCIYKYIYKHIYILI